MNNSMNMGMMTGLKPSAIEKMARKIGYAEDMTNFPTYLSQNPDAYNKLNTMASNLMRKYANGGLVTALPTQPVPQQQFTAGSDIAGVSSQMITQPGLPVGTAIQPVGTQVSQEQLVAPTSGQVSGQVSVPTAQAVTAQAQQPATQQAATISAQAAAPDMQQAMQNVQAAAGTIDPRAEVIAAQQTATSVGNVQAAQGNAILMDNPVQREIQNGELISGVADAEKASKFVEQVEAAQATPSAQATVQGQLAQLTANFDMNNPPEWAAGTLRAVQEQLIARGLSASSIAGQALIQGALESAIPIAQADASIFAQFEQQNLSNRQQTAMFAAQQRAAFLGQEFDQAFQARVANSAKIADIANLNFTAEQQIALENSRNANTVNLNNLSNRQAKVMAEAAALAQLDMANLNNRQQAAVQNAQNFLQMDLTNLSNQQQTELFKSQQIANSLLTDAAAENAARQFNATSENQVNQFFANLAGEISTFNAAQANAQNQFNAQQANVVERFNAEINDARDRFNAQNRLVIDQSNAQWRRTIATADTAVVNRANELNAQAVLGISQQAYNNLWQQYADTIEFAWRSGENELERKVEMAIAKLDASTRQEIQAEQSSSAAGTAIGGLLGTLGSALIGGIFSK